MILIVSSPEDDHTRAVLERLEGAETQLLDLSEFPLSAELSLEYYRNRSADHHMSGNGFDVSLSECNVVWWRRPQPFRFHPELGSTVDRNFAYLECKSALDGLWMTLDAFWVNHPVRDEVASRKVYQLEVARDVGFDVPESCITNSPGKAREFIERHGVESTVYKAFSATERAWRETRVLDPEEVTLLDNVRYSPVIFQEYVPVQVDLRVTVVGDEIFATAIHTAETDYEVDSRVFLDEVRMEEFDLPERVIDRIDALIDGLELEYGAIDIRLTPDNRYVFLEINPAGQWRFVEERTGQPITDAFATLLLDHSREANRR